MILSIEQIVKYIQYHTGDTLEEIANKTGYSRPYINNLKNAGKSHVELQAALVKAYPDLLQDVSADKMVLNIINEDLKFVAGQRPSRFSCSLAVRPSYSIGYQVWLDLPKLRSQLVYSIIRSSLLLRKANQLLPVAHGNNLKTS